MISVRIFFLLLPIFYFSLRPRPDGFKFDVRNVRQNKKRKENPTLTHSLCSQLKNFSNIGYTTLI